jgi:tetratricopeptide (TPR) repeat protein
MAVRAPEGSKPNVALGAAATHAIAAGHLHDAAAAKQALAEYEKSLHELEHSPDAYMAKFFDNEHDEVRAFAAYAQGNGDEAVRLLRSIADDQDKTGKGETALPAREMVADLLLDMNKPQEALAEYQLSLKTDPNRFNGLYGAAQAAERIGNAQLASTYYAQLVKNCAGSSTPRPELARARTITVAAQ